MVHKVVISFIPTYVGATGYEPHGFRQPCFILSMSAQNCGSSPHAWGQLTENMVRSSGFLRFIPTCMGAALSDVHHEHDVFRFIPTCVGAASPAPRSAPLPLPVHPHMRGGQRIASTVTGFFLYGSSPHAWGQRGGGGLFAMLIIGSSPHAWGQRFLPGRAATSQCGSSPHAWGQLTTHAKRMEYTDGSSPHAWGQRFSSSPIRSMLYGSSPHAWGQRWYPGGRQISGSVHPHMRGGSLFLAFCCCGCFCGSSPHAWGQRHLQRGFRRHVRFIPTCVGGSWPGRR